MIECAGLPDDPVAKKAAVSLAEDLTATESALRARMRDTMLAATAVLRAVDGLSGGSDGNASAIRPLPGPEEKKLKSLVTMLKVENGRLLKESLLDHTAIKDLEANVADREAELLVLNRRLAMAEERERERSDDGGDGGDGGKARGGGGEGGSRKAGGKDEDNDDDNIKQQSNKRQKTEDGEPRVELDLAIQEVERRDKQIASLERCVPGRARAGGPPAPLRRAKKRVGIEVWRADPLR